MSNGQHWYYQQRKKRRTPPPGIDDQEAGLSPRCYFCGAKIVEEKDILKIQHHAGNGYYQMVFICPRCEGNRQADIAEEAARRQAIEAKANEIVDKIKKWFFPG